VIRFGCRFGRFKLRRGFEISSDWFFTAHAVRLVWFQSKKRRLVLAV
jgi:hypothetical protein